jgi:hypothetical protein
MADPYRTYFTPTYGPTFLRSTYMRPFSVFSIASGFGKTAEQIKSIMLTADNA